MLHGPLHLPFLCASGRVDRVRARFGREVHRAGDDDGARLQRRDLRQRIAAHGGKLRDVAAIECWKRPRRRLRANATIGLASRVRLPHGWAELPDGIYALVNVEWPLIVPEAERASEIAPI